MSGAKPQTSQYRPRQDIPVATSGEVGRPSFGPSGHDVGVHMKGGENNTYAGGYGDGGVYGDMLLPEAAGQGQGQVNAPKSRPPQFAGGDHLGYLSAEGESGDNPGEISPGAGDYGGKSYGVFQFSSNMGVPQEFIAWLAANNPYVFKRLQAAETADGRKYGPNFDAEWRRIAEENPDGFRKMQYDFSKQKYYDSAAAAIKEQTGFDFNTRGYALKSVLWSRAVHHGPGKNGVGGVINVVKNALRNVDLTNASDEQIMRAIYAESGGTKDEGDEDETPLTEDTIRASVRPEHYDWYLKIARDNNLLGKYTKYFSGSNAQQQISVWNRLNNEELQKALDLHKKHD